MSTRLKAAFVAAFTLTTLTFLLLTITTASARPPQPEASIGPPQAQAAAAGPVSGGQFRYPTAEPGSLDPIAMDREAYPILGQVFEGLTKWDENLIPVPAIAASWETVDALTWTFHLRDDVTFHNGRLVTAQDFVNSWDRAVGSEWWDDYMAPMVSHYHAPNDITFEVVLNEPFAPLPSLLPMPCLAAVPAEAVATIDTHPVGAGPFAFDQWQPGDAIVLLANEGYYDGRPVLDRIDYRFYGGEGDMFNDFQSGNLDLSPVPDDRLAEVSCDPNLMFGDQLCLYHYGMKVEWPPFDDVRVRQALNYAVHKPDVVHNALPGYRVVADGPVPPGMQGYDPAVTAYEYDPSLALDLLAQAGWTDTNSDGILDDGAGTDLTIELWYNTSPNHEAFANAVADDFRDIGGTGLGATVVISHTEWDTFRDNVDQYPMYRSGWCCAYPDPYDFLYPLFHSDTTGGRTNYHNTQVDTWLDQALQTPDLAARQALYALIEEQVQQDASVINLYYYKPVHIKQPSVHGLALLGYPLATRMEEVWLEGWKQLAEPMIAATQVGALAVHPGISGTLYAAAQPRGASWDVPSTIFKSTDGGASWIEVYVTPYPSQIQGLAATDAFVYAGAYDRTNWEERPLIYRSTDGGSSWVPALSLTDGTVWAFAVHPTLSQTAIAGGGDYPDKAMLYQTTDGGLTWTEVFSYTNPGFYATVNAALIHPTTPLTWLLAHDGEVNGGYGSYIHRSTDGGVTWTEVLSTSEDSIASLVANPLTPTILYAGSWDTNNFFRSADGGATWTRVISDGTAGQILALDPPDTLYGNAGSEVRKSTDGGDTWTTVGSLPDEVRSLAIDLGPIPGALYARLQHPGVYKSIDGGANWEQRNNGIETPLLPHDIVVDPQNMDKLFVATYGTGGWMTTDGGDAWVELPVAGHMGCFAVNPEDPGTVYGGESNCVRGSVIRSTDGGLTFESVYTATFITPDCSGGGESIFALAIAPSMTATVYAAGVDRPGWEDGHAVVLRSLNDGLSWTEAVSLPAPSLFLALAIDPSDEQVVYAGGEDCSGGPCEGVVYRTTNGGDDWSLVLTAGDTVQSIVIDHQDPSVLYVASNSYDIYKSTDGGDTWDTVRTCCPSGDLLAMDPHDSSHLYLGGWGYIAETFDGGQTWSDWDAPINQGIPPMDPRDLTIDNGTEVQTLYAGFYGIWAYSRPVLQPPGPRYVATTGSDGSNDCRDPGAPCRTIGHAIRQAVAGDAILVAGGTYNESLTICQPLSLQGGYESAAWTRDLSLYDTVVDGVAGPQPVVWFQPGSDGALLDGLTVTGGDEQGGVVVDGAAVDIANCQVTDNFNELDWGGGVHVRNEATVVISQTTITRNGSGSAGGLGILPDSDVTLVDSVVSENWTTWGAGGGIGMWWGTTLIVSDSVISDNTTPSSGGGIHISDGAELKRMTNTLVVRNQAQGGGAGVDNWQSSATLINVTLADNLCSAGASCTAGLSSSGAEAVVTITNSILAFNGGDDLDCPEGTCVVSYSDIGEGLWPGTGNISGDPVFVDLAGGDYHLLGPSPCIDKGTPAGAPAYDLDGTSRDAQPDMGAYEFVNQAPSLGTVTPSSGSGSAGAAMAFITWWSDPNGWEDLKQCIFHIGASPSAVNNVTLMYNAQKNKLWIRSSDGRTWVGGYTPGSSRMLENSQVQVDCSLTIVQGSEDRLIVAWRVTFKPTFTGNKKLYLKCTDVHGVSAKGAKKGTWTVE